MKREDNLLSIKGSNSGMTIYLVVL